MTARVPRTGKGWAVNLSQVITKFDLLEGRIGPGVRARVKTLAEQILEASKTIPPMCPVDTGALEATGRVEQAPGGQAVVYGGSGVEYANPVHDDLRPRRYKKPGSGPKFVETHFLRLTGAEPIELDKAISRIVKEVFG